MSIALVQSFVFHGSTSSPMTLTFASATTAGNLLTWHGDFAGSGTPGAITSIADTASNTWTVWTTNSSTNQNPPFAEVDGNTISFCAWTLNAASVTSITLTFPILVFSTSVIAEWSGATSADTAAAQVIKPIGAGLTGSQALTLAQSNELVLLSANIEATTWGGAPSQLSAFPGGSSPYIGYALNQSGSQTYTWTNAGSATDAATIAVAAFAPPAPPATGPAYTACMASM